MVCCHHKLSTGQLDRSAQVKMNRSGNCSDCLSICSIAKANLANDPLKYCIPLSCNEWEKTYLYKITKYLSKCQNVLKNCVNILPWIQTHQKRIWRKSQHWPRYSASSNLLVSITFNLKNMIKQLIVGNVVPLDFMFINWIHFCYIIFGVLCVESF